MELKELKCDQILDFYVVLEPPRSQANLLYIFPNLSQASEGKEAVSKVRLYIISL